MSAHSVYVSLATISRRLQDVHVTVTSILNQTLPPTQPSKGTDSLRNFLREDE